MTPYKHAESSAKRFGGIPLDYIHIHDWFDETKQYTGDWTHRAMRHHAAGIQWCIQEFGHAIRNLDGNEIPIKLIAEQHVTEDCGFIPTVQDWTKSLAGCPQDWMLKVKVTSEKEMEADASAGQFTKRLVSLAKVNMRRNCMNAEPLTEEIFNKAKRLGIKRIALSFSGGNDEGYLDVTTEPYCSSNDWFEHKIKNWAWKTYEYSGAGDGNEYGDDIAYDIENRKVIASTWYMTREDIETVELDLETK